MDTLFLILFLLFFSASFSSFETAIFSIKPVERHRLEEGGGIFAIIARLIQKPREFLTTILLGNEVVNVAISILAGSVAYQFMGKQETRAVYVLSTAVTTFVILIVGEIIPKNVAVRMPLLVAQVFIVPYQLFAWVVYPFRVFFVMIAYGIIRMFGADPRKGRRLLVEEELRTLLELGKSEGTLADFERTLIQNSLDFSNVRISQAMTPREKIVAVSVDRPISEILKTVAGKNYSRLPVYEENLDHVIGILHAKELLPFRLSIGSAKMSLKEILKPYVLVRPEDTLDFLFEKFQELRVHMAIVANSQGQVVGLITMDDLLRRFFPIL